MRGIAPDSDKAPKSIAAALEEYFGITGGKLQNLTESERTGLAQNNIILAATGQKGADPNIVIVDRGEGQSPNRMPDTILSIRKKNHVDGIYTREAQLDRKFRIRFKTDACNDFISREKYPGTYILTRDNETAEDHMVHLHNGIATLSVELPDTAKIGDAFKYRFVITDTNVDRDFENEFEIHIVGLQDTTGGHNGRRTPPNGENSEKDTFKPSGISLPKVEEIYKDRWDECGFTKESALVVKKYEEAYDFFVNMDNIHLQTEIKPIVKNEGKMKLLKARYKYSMVLIGLGVLGYYDNHQSEESGETVAPEEMIEKISAMLSPVLLPMIDVMGDDMSDILN